MRSLLSDAKQRGPPRKIPPPCTPPPKLGSKHPAAKKGGRKPEPRYSCTEATTARQLSQDFQMPTAGPRVDRGTKRVRRGQFFFLVMTQPVPFAELLRLSLLGRVGKHTHGRSGRTSG